MRVYEREREGKGKETEKPQSVGGDGVLRGGERGKDQRTPGKKRKKGSYNGTRNREAKQPRSGERDGRERREGSRL